MLSRANPCPMNECVSQDALSIGGRRRLKKSPKIRPQLVKFYEHASFKLYLN
jgi:hypothetical protein